MYVYIGKEAYWIDWNYREGWMDYLKPGAGQQAGDLGRKWCCCLDAEILTLQKLALFALPAFYLCGPTILLNTTPFIWSQMVIGIKQIYQYLGQCFTKGLGSVAWPRWHNMNYHSCISLIRGFSPCSLPITIHILHSYKDCITRIYYFYYSYNTCSL